LKKEFGISSDPSTKDKMDESKSNYLMRDLN
jgi:hypothetical protein